MGTVRVTVRVRVRVTVRVGKSLEGQAAPASDVAPYRLRHEERKGGQQTVDPEGPNISLVQGVSTVRGEERKSNRRTGFFGTPGFTAGFATGHQRRKGLKWEK